MSALQKNPLVELSEQSIGFKYAEGTFLNSSVKMKNISPQKITFKLKTTNPKSFTVKPIKGELLPSETIVIEITMQPMVVLNKQNLNNLQIQEKFLIMAMEIPTSLSFQEVEELWKKKTADKSDDIQSIKLGVYLYIDEKYGNRTHIEPTLTESRITDGSNITAFSQEYKSGVRPMESTQTSKTISNLNSNQDYKKKYEENCNKYGELMSQIHDITIERDQLYREMMELRLQTQGGHHSSKAKSIIIMAIVSIISYLIPYLLFKRKITTADMTQI